MSLQRLQQLSTRVIESFENKKIPFYYYILSLIGLTMIRHFLEAFSSRDNYFNYSAARTTTNTIHYTLSFITIGLLVALLISLIARVNIEKVLRATMSAMLLILLCPILDIIISGGKGTDLTYLNTTYESSASIWKMYYTYCSNCGRSIPPGLKIEVGIFLSLIFAYALLKKAGVLRSLVTAWSAYTIIFITAGSPFIISYIQSALGYPAFVDSQTLLYFFLLVDFVLLLVTGYLMDKKMFTALLADMRWPRILYYELVLLFGAAVSLKYQPAASLKTLLADRMFAINLPLAMISVLFAGLFSIMINNLNDIDIDKISNPHRPLINGCIDIPLYTSLAYVFMGLALFYAGMADGNIFLIIATTISSYYLYSSPPIRFKRVPVLSKAVIGLNSFALAILGFLLAHHDLRSFPPEMAWIFLLGITLASNFIDLKDVQGDKAAGILTLPVLIGERWTKLLTGTIFFCVSLSFYFVFEKAFAWPLLMLNGALFFYLMNKSNYKDWHILVLSDLNFAFMIAYLVI